MKTTFYLFLSILFLGQIAHAQTEIIQKNYTASGEFEYETILIEEEEQNDPAQAILDSFRIAREEEQWKEWYAKNKKQFTLPAGATALSCMADSTALVALYNATNGANWKNKWDLSQPMRTWHGVTVNEAGCVTELKLSGNKLIGTLPNEIGDLINLFVLDLNVNELKDSIPASIANLSNLKSLQISNNKMTGKLPAKLGVLTDLTYLSLYSNSFTGEMPQEWSALTKLETLLLYANQLSGNIPNWLGNMTNLTRIDLDINHFTGSIPMAFSNLVNLKVLYLSSNELTGTVPTWLGDLPKLETLFLGDNKFTGGLPESLGKLSNLTYLGLASMKLKAIPSWVSNLSNLEYLNLIGNQITSIPTELGSLSNLSGLYLSGNQITSIPAELGSLSNLEDLNLSGNQITSIPAELGSLSNLEDLRLSNNQITSIPAELGSLSNLKYLYLYDNQITSIPVELESLSKLINLNLSDNLLDSCPDFTDHPMLTSLVVYDNKLTFEDLIYNKEFFSSKNDYRPQEKFGISDTITLSEGDNYTISFNIDSSITDNNYNWYKNNRLIHSTSTPSLTLTDVMLNNRGIYQCKVTNPDLPELTLESNPITINYTLPSVPPNDKCADAILLTMGNLTCTNPTTGFNIGATNSNNDNPAPPSINYHSFDENDVWYKFTVPPSGVFGLDIKKGNEGTYNFWHRLYSGTCGALTYLSGIGGNNWSSDFSENYKAPAGTTIYLRVWYGDSEKQAGIFEVCVYERPCKTPSIGWQEKLSCTDTTEYLVDFEVYDMGDASSLTIFNDRGIPSINNITQTGFYRIGPFKRDSITNFTIQHNQNSTCNRKAILDGPYLKGNIATNDEPCTAINLNAYIDSTYTYTQGGYRASVKACEPVVPIKNSCREVGSWRNQRIYRSIWFSFTAPASGSVVLEGTFKTRIAIWSASSCNDLLGGNPSLEYAIDPCNDRIKHNVYCLNAGETYYVQLVNIYSDFDISIKEVNVPCNPIKNDQCINATAIPVATDVCPEYPIYTNIGATNSKNDPSPPSKHETYGTDVWFSSVVPASGNLAIGFDEVDNCHCKGIINLYEGSCGSLNRIYAHSYFNVERNTVMFFKDLTPGTTVYYNIDFKNKRDTTGYFKMCVFDPSCLPMEWNARSKVACADSQQFIVDINVHNLGTASSFDIINYKDSTIYHDNLTSTGIYRIGPFDRYGGAHFQIIHQNDAFCSSDKQYYGMIRITDEPSNNNICNAADLNGIINESPMSFTNISNSNIEDCEPIPPSTSCGLENGWSGNFYGSSWSKFTANSNKMSLTVNMTETGYNNLKVALWKAKDCMDLKDGNGVFVKGKDPCDNFNQTLNLTFDNLEIGAKYFVQIATHRNYAITLTAENPKEIFNCDGTDLTIPSVNRKNYSASKTIISDAIVTSDSLIFTAGASITLKAGFHVQSTEFHAYIATCTLSTILPERVAALAPNKKIAEEVQLQVAPNPFVQEASIRFYLPEASQASLYVFDLNGQLLTEQAVESAKGWNSSRLDASNLVPGMYLVVLQTPKGRWTKKVMVIQ